MEITYTAFDRNFTAEVTPVSDEDLRGAQKDFPEWLAANSIQVLGMFIAFDDKQLRVRTKQPNFRKILLEYEGQNHIVYFCSLAFDRVGKSDYASCLFFAIYDYAQKSLDKEPFLVRLLTGKYKGSVARRLPYNKVHLGKNPSTGREILINTLSAKNMEIVWDKNERPHVAGLEHFPPVDFKDSLGNSIEHNDIIIYITGSNDLSTGIFVDTDRVKKRMIIQNSSGSRETLGDKRAKYNLKHLNLEQIRNQILANKLAR